MTTRPLATDQPHATGRAVAFRSSALLWIAILTPAVLLVHGYHPFAEDAGIYVSGIQKLANPALYQPDSAFVLAHTHLSLFAHLFAWGIRITRSPLEPTLFAAYLASIFLFLLACWTLAQRIFPTSAQRWSAVALAAATFTLPIAGTSLILMDPYVTARSFAMPLGLFALTAAIDRQGLRCLLLLLLSALLHPLMTLYATAFLAFFVLIDCGLPRAAFVLSAEAISAAAIVFFLTHHVATAPEYRQAILSRGYLFPSRWAGYEYLGLGMPLILFALAARRPRTIALIRALCFAACMLGISSTLIAVLFVHPTGSLLLASLQPLRCFHILYSLGAILIGGLLGGLFFRLGRGFRAAAAVCVTLCLVATGFYFVQRATYRLSAHVELPGHAPLNPWQQAFVWIRANTPRNAVFAANPHLVFVDGEDGQSFRATTERSLLADDKDEGVVVVFPYLAREWASQRNPQANVDRLTDSQRIARLRPLGANWVLLSSSAVTALPCPYRNAVAQVCRLQSAEARSGS